MIDAISVCTALARAPSPQHGTGQAACRDSSSPHVFTRSTTLAPAICVRVVTENEIQGVHATSHWIVATPDPDEAVQTVRKQVSPRCQVRATRHHVSPETILRIGLGPGQAHLL
jgi:hypothetical protein